jgi:hypothetical protein
MAQAFGGGFGGRFRGSAFRGRGADRQFGLTVDFLELIFLINVLDFHSV